MPDLSPDARKALAYWGVIEGATTDRTSTADLWSAIKDAAEARGLASPGITIQGVNELRAYATDLRNARETLAAAESGTTIDAGMIGTPPWARSLTEQNTLSVYQVRFQHTTTVSGVEQTDWRSVLIRGQLPSTTDELAALVESDAFNMAQTYDAAHVGIDSLSIYQV